MAFIDPTEREIMMKVVYYGPPLSGKTTNLKALHSLAPTQQVGRLMNLEPRGDSTLFFDRLPVRLMSEGGVAIKLKILTVPAQPIHRSTRRIILKGADAIVFVADSQKDATTSNKKSFSDLRANLEHLGIERAVSLVLQFNKQDLPFIRTPAELAKFGKRVSSPVIAAQAIHGIGVIESLRTALSSVWESIQATHDVVDTIGCHRADYESALCWDWRNQLPYEEAIF